MRDAQLFGNSVTYKTYFPWLAAAGAGLASPPRGGPHASGWAGHRSIPPSPLLPSFPFFFLFPSWPCLPSLSLPPPSSSPSSACFVASVVVAAVGVLGVVVVAVAGGVAGGAVHCLPAGLWPPHGGAPEAAANVSRRIFFHFTPAGRPRARR